MAKPNPKTDADAIEPEEKKAKSSGKGRLLIGAFVSAVIVAETAIFFFLVPSGEDVAAIAESRLIEKVQSESVEHAETDENKIVEVDLGGYGIAFMPTGTTRSQRVEFKLFGTVLAKNANHMRDLIAEHRGRFRNRIIFEVRNATPEELNESQLGLIQRRFLATSIEVFGEPILLNVGFEDYQVVED